MARFVANRRGGRNRKGIRRNRASNVTGEANETDIMEVTSDQSEGNSTNEVGEEIDQPELDLNASNDLIDEESENPVPISASATPNNAAAPTPPSQQGNDAAFPTPPSQQRNEVAIPDYWSPPPLIEQTLLSRAQQHAATFRPNENRPGYRLLMPKIVAVKISRHWGAHNGHVHFFTQDEHRDRFEVKFEIKDSRNAVVWVQSRVERGASAGVGKLMNAARDLHPPPIDAPSQPRFLLSEQQVALLLGKRGGLIAYL